LCLACLAAAAWSPASAAAQASDGPSGRPISGIRLIVDGRETREPELLRVLETRVGDPYTSLHVRESIVHLMALRRFEDVSVSAETTAAGVVLTYELDPVLAVTGIRLRGSLGLPSGELRAVVVNRYGTAPPLERGDEIAGVLESFLHGRGFRSARVTAGHELKAGGSKAVLVFNVAAGSRAQVASLRITGPRVDNGVQVASRLRVRVGSSFDRADVMNRIERYTEDLHKEGFLQARVDLEEKYSPDGQQADVTITLVRGPHVTLVFRGDPLPEDQRNELVPIHREGSVDVDILEDSSRRIEEYLRGQGYREATAPYTSEPKGEDELLLVFTVKRGPQYKVADIEITGARQIPPATLAAGLKLQKGQWFVKGRLDGDAAVISEQYHRQGFREVKVEPSVAAQATQEALLTARIAVTEGPRTTIQDTTFEGNQAIPAATLRTLVGSLPGRPYYQPQAVTDRDAVLFEYLERGYELAAVDLQRTFSDDGTRATLRFVINEGPRIVIDQLLVVGNQRTSVDTIERETGLTTGMPLSISRLIDAQRRLSALGLFRRVQVSELQQGSETHRDVLVVVEEGPVNTIGYGGGLEGALRTKSNAATGTAVESFEVSPRGFVELGRRNLGGKNRSVTMFARAAIRSNDVVNADQRPEGVPPLEDEGAGFREYRVLGTYREPRFLDTGFDLLVSADAEQAIRSSFDFNRRQIFAEGSRRFHGVYSAAGRYSLGRTRLFNERIAEEDQIDIDRIFNPGVRTGTASVSLSRDTRDDALEPTRGELLLGYGSLAAKVFGSEVGFVKTYLQGFMFRPVSFMPGTVVAVGARLGLARGFTQLERDDQGNTVVTRVSIVPASERFFGGGDSTVRGFAQDRLGTDEILDRNGVSRGGNGLLIFNGELRFPLLRRFSLGGAAFVDVGNVFEFATDINLGDLRGGAGFGLRWKSPVGPLRVDLGWKLKTVRFPNGELEPRFAPYFTIGQAF
jgi:outer membrane protein assembly factor BamA